MTARPGGKVDVSTTWPPCARCPHKHPSHAPCPPSGVWLVLTLCRRCKPPEGYCGPHGGRRRLEAVPDEVPLIGPDEQAEHRRRIGEQP